MLRMCIVMNIFCLIAAVIAEQFSVAKLVYSYQENMCSQFCAYIFLSIRISCTCSVLIFQHI